MAKKTMSPRQTLNNLRSRQMGWLVPFYCSVDSYYTENGLAVLSVFTWRFGQQVWETWQLKEGFDATWVQSLKDCPADMYDRLKRSGDLVHRHCLGGN
ncbi:MAG: hypothetical protein AAF151_20985 [Cyanobacteria bacterium J06656_5]